MTVLTSTRNPRVRAAAALARRRGRVGTGRFLLDGPNAVEGALHDDVLVEVFATEQVAGDWAARLPDGVVLTLVAEHVLGAISDTRSPQGVVGVGLMRPVALDRVPAGGLLLVCHEASDPGNAGTVVRVADAVAADGVVLCHGSVDPWNPKAVRASAGSLTHVPLVVDVATADVVAAERDRGRLVVALDATGDVDVEDVRPRGGGVALVTGSEAHGLPDEVRDACDVVASLPIWGRAESLNLGTATAVASYALARRVRTGG